MDGTEDSVGRFWDGVERRGVARDGADHRLGARLDGRWMFNDNMRIRRRTQLV